MLRICIGFNAYPDTDLDPADPNTKTDTDRIQIQGFDNQKIVKKFTAEIKF